MNNEFEVNPLTRIPGGSFITLEFQNGDYSRGVNVKSIKKYVETVLTESLLKGNPLVKVYNTSTNDLIYSDGKFYL